MLEQIICEHLQGSGQLAALLASYDGKPAVFDYKVPAEDDVKWQGEARYGRVVFTMQTRDDPGRTKNGSLSVGLLSEKDTQRYKDMEPIVRNRLDGYFFTSEDQIISLKWMRRRPVREEAASACEGVIMDFKVYTYPVLSAGNPAALLLQWSRQCMEAMSQDAYFMGGGESLPQVFRPTAEKPAIYWRLTKIVPCSWLKDRAAVDWRTASIQGHIIVPGCIERETDIVLKLDQAIAAVERISHEDVSLFVSRDDAADVTVDSMRQGQLTVAATYGIPAVKAQSEKMQNITVKMK